MKHRFLCLLLSLLASSISGLGAPLTSVSAPTTTTHQWLAEDSLTHTNTATKRDPRKATARSLVFPGLGQLYNGQPWKLGLIYGGAGAAFYFFQTNQQL